MEIVYTRRPIVQNENSVFLAGPSPRDRSVKSWRPEALDMLKAFKFNGVVYVPEHADDRPFFEKTEEDAYVSQCEWEWEALHAAKKIVFWVPRDLDTLPAFTTNIEFGFYIRSGKVVYGRPEGSPKNDYLDWLYKKITGDKPLTTLDGVIYRVCYGAKPKIADAVA